MTSDTYDEEFEEVLKMKPRTGLPLRGVCASARALLWFIHSVEQCGDLRFACSPVQEICCVHVEVKSRRGGQNAP